MMHGIEIFELKTGDGACTLHLVPECGGLINHLQLPAPNGERVQLIAGLADAESMRQNDYYRGVVLYPFPNRLDAGRYNYAGKDYQFEINEKGNNNRLHGFLYSLKATVVGHAEGETESWVELAYPVDGNNEGYPFSADVHLRYVINSERGMSLDFKVKNRHSETVPVGIGWHPYLQLPNRRVDELELTTPAFEHTPVDERMLPLGAYEPYEAYCAAKAIGDTRFDDCFRLQAAPAMGEACVKLYSPEDKLGLEIWQQSGPKGYNYVQLCIPPDRQSIAIEPMTCGINAFNTGVDLLELAPEEELHARCGIRLVN